MRYGNDYGRDHWWGRAVHGDSGQGYSRDYDTGMRGGRTGRGGPGQGMGGRARGRGGYDRGW